jgi:hypothetical protein
MTLKFGASYRILKRKIDMNKKLCFAVITAALLLALGVAANGWFVSQQGVFYFKVQQEAFLESLRQSSLEKIDPGA